MYHKLHKAHRVENLTVWSDQSWHLAYPLKTLYHILLELFHKSLNAEYSTFKDRISFLQELPH